MDYELFIFTELSIESLTEIIQRLITDSDEEVSIHYNEEEVTIGSAYFSLALEIEDISDISFIRQHYNLDVNVCIRVEIFGKTSYQGFDLLFKVIGGLLTEMECNLLFLENGSYQLLRRENGQLYINNHLDEYQVKYLTQDRLDLLNQTYVEKRLSN